MSRKIVFINQATGYLTIDIINVFANEFDEVALITGSIRVQNIQLNPKVKISKIIRYNRGNTLWKSVSWFLGTIHIYFLLIWKYRYFEKFFFTIPPTAYLLPLSRKSLMSITIYDLYPDALKAYGFTEESLVFKWWSEKNRKIFSKAHRIYTLSEYMKTQILTYSPYARVNMIPNWSAFSGILPVHKSDNKLIKEHCLAGKFLIQYSGNIGFTHPVESIIEAAEFLKSYDDILFLIIGRGERYKIINNMIQVKELQNCLMLPFRPDDELFDSLCAADLSILILDDKVPNISVPSKAYNILSAGAPILAIASPESGIGELISENQIGKVFSKNDIEGICSYILELKKDSIQYSELSQKSLLAARKYTSMNANKYLEIYKQI